MDSNFIEEFSNLSDVVHEIALAHGWDRSKKPDAETICLMHAELSEGLEALREGNGPSDHIPDFTGIEEEMADVIIRIMDFAKAKGHRIPEAIIAKVAFNKTRPYKHGGKKF